MQNQLQLAMKNFQADPSKANETALIDALNKAEFLAPVILAAPLAKQDGSAYYEEEGSNIKFAILEDDKSSEGYFPAFSDRAQMHKWRADSEQEALPLRLKDYFGMLSDESCKFKGIVVDAFGANLILNKMTISKITKL